MSSTPLREPIPAGPFLWWCWRREARIRAELDHLPLVQGDTKFNTRARLSSEIGWDTESGRRRLHRMFHEPTYDGMVEREQIEEALFSAGVPFYEVYPGLDLDVPDNPESRWCPTCSEHALTSAAGECLWCDEPLTREAINARRVDLAAREALATTALARERDIDDRILRMRALGKSWAETGLAVGLGEKAVTNRARRLLAAAQMEEAA